MKWNVHAPGKLIVCIAPVAFYIHQYRIMFGFKEWALICDALGHGEQSVILRKGGIAEGRAGFRFAHPEFWLFPTLFHEQATKLKVPSGTLLPAPRGDGLLEIRYAARVEWTEELALWDKVQALAPFHLWEEPEIEKRFRQDAEPKLSLAFVRVLRLSEPFVLPDSPRYGGCRSWVELPEPPGAVRLAAVLDDAAHREREKAIRAAIAG